MAKTTTTTKATKSNQPQIIVIDGIVYVGQFAKVGEEITLSDFVCVGETQPNDNTIRQFFVAKAKNELIETQVFGGAGVSYSTMAFPPKLQMTFNIMAMQLEQSTLNAVPNLIAADFERTVS
jgi:hypothetical protein